MKIGVGAALAVGPLAGCSGSNALVGSDGSTAGNGSTPSGGGGSMAGGGVGSAAGASPVAGATTVGSTTYFIEELFANDKCLPEPLPDDGAACKMLVADRTTACTCDGPRLAPTTAALTASVRAGLQQTGVCDTGGDGCKDYCVCELTGASGDSLTQCQTEDQPDAASSGWCYVAAGQGSAQAAQVANCPTSSPEKVRFIGDATPIRGELVYLACLNASATVTPAALGQTCVPTEEYNPAFPGFDLNIVAVANHASQCQSNLCLVNHFQGRVSCPYGHQIGGDDCLLPGSTEATTVQVEPQLIDRRADIASICSCQCDGTGPGSYCTCPESMQCEHLIDDLGLGNDSLAGSYCIPKGSGENYESAVTDGQCAPGKCGPSHPY